MTTTTTSSPGSALAIPDMNVGNLIALIEREHISARKELEDGRWAAHIALHLAAGGVAEKAASDVKEALDKAAGEVTQRLTDVRSYIDAALASHGDLHEADRTALNLARGTIDSRLEDMNQLRTQINNERGKYVDGDRLASLLAALKNELNSQMAVVSTDAKSTRDGNYATLQSEITAGVDERRRLTDRVNTTEQRLTTIESSTAQARANRTQTNWSTALVVTTAFGILGALMGIGGFLFAVLKP